MSIPTGITMVQTYLDLDLATNLLSTNINNRPPKSAVITRYADDMMNGRWQFTAEAIKVDKNGILLDGQNRCLALQRACELSGREISVPILLVRGLEPESQDVMDTGRTRSVADQLARRRVPHYAVAAGSLRLIDAFNRGMPAGAYRSSKSLASHSAIMLLWDDISEGLTESILANSQYGNSSGIYPSAATAAHYLISRACADQTAIEEFFSGVRTGENLRAGSPMLAMRNRMLTARNTNERVDSMIQMFMILRAWNAWRKGEQMHKFPIRSNVILTSKTITP